MSAYKDFQKLVNNFSNIKMDARDDTVDDARLPPSNAPPDFDFNSPCRFFKSSFARSLSLSHASSSNNSQCKSLDYDIRANNNYNNKISCMKRDMTSVSAVPPLPQKRLNQAGSFYQQNEANISSEQKQVITDTTTANDYEKPPALPARRPLSLHNLTLSQNLSVNECQMNAEQKFQQTALTQLKQHVYKQSTNSSPNNSIKPVNGNNNNSSGCNRKNNIDQPTPNQKPQPHHFSATTCKNVSGSSNSCNSSSIKCNNNNNNFRRNINNNSNNIAWPNQDRNMEQDFNTCTYNQGNEADDGNELTCNYQDTLESAAVNEYNNHFHNSHQLLITTTNVLRNQQQRQQNQQQYQQQQQQQQHHQMPSYEILNDNTANVEAVILQNQVDTLQWQLKQVETSCDMYRAVMEEVARFLERYQSQKQHQQQQLQQQQQQMAAQKQHNNNTNSNNNNINKLEQMPRSKSLFQVYIGGGHDKSKNENNNSLDDTSPTESYLRARSSTNLIDLKHQQLNVNCNSKSKDDHIYETGLTPSQSYSAFKDFTWRRSPKKSDSRLNIAKDDVEEKLNQEAFRLLRTIQNLINTSQHQPDLAHQRHSLGFAAAPQTTRLSKALSTTSVLTLPGAPMLNSTNLTISATGNTSCLTTDSTNAPPTTAITANNAATNNLAPEMLFLRSANMRDSRLSLRSSTDSSVHSTSSAASSASSKVETDEEPSTPFHSTPNILTHKQHHHLTGSSTEDESGFSSISSFPDIGLPLAYSTVSNAHSSNQNRLMGKDPKPPKANERDSQQSLTTDSRNSTLKANIVGLPLNSSQDMSHRWDSPSKTYHNASNKFQKFSALTNEDSNTVLWV